MTCSWDLSADVSNQEGTKHAKKANRDFAFVDDTMQVNRRRYFLFWFAASAASFNSYFA